MDKKLREVISEVKGLSVRSYDDVYRIWHERLLRYWFQVDIACFDEYVRLKYGGHHNQWEDGITFGSVAEDFNDYIDGEDWEEDVVVPLEVFAYCSHPSDCGWTDHGQELPDYMHVNNPRFVGWAENVHQFCVEWEQEKESGKSKEEMIDYLESISWGEVDFSEMDPQQVESVYNAMVSHLER